MPNLKTLPELKPQESGKIVEIRGGICSIKHLENLGLRVGKRITKISAQIFRGPQVIKVDNTRIAIGFGMAKKIIVEVEQDSEKDIISG